MSQLTSEGTRRSDRQRRAYNPHAFEDVAGSDWQQPKRPVPPLLATGPHPSTFAPSASLYASSSPPKVKAPVPHLKKVRKMRVPSRQQQWSADDRDALDEAFAQASSPNRLAPPSHANSLLAPPSMSLHSSTTPPAFITHVDIPPFESQSPSDLSDDDFNEQNTAQAAPSDTNSVASSISTSYSIDSPSLNALSPAWRAIRDFDVSLLEQHRVLTFKNVYPFSDQLDKAYTPIMSGVENSLRFANPTQYCEATLSLWLRLKVLFVPMLLRYNSSLNVIKARLLLFRTKQWATLLRDLRADLLQPKLVQKQVAKKYGKTVSDPNNLDHRYKLASASITEDGDISKAYSIITSPAKYEPPTIASVDYLRSLHPPQLPENVVPQVLKNVANTTGRLPQITKEIIYAAIKKMKNGKKPGLDGLRKEHLLAMSRKGSASWLTSEASLATAVSNGEIPHEYRTFLTSTVLIGLPKPGEHFKRRPIGINSTWLKMVDNAVLSFVNKDFMKLLAPFQFGLEPSGPESLIQCLRQTLRENPGWVVLKLDVKNAFNTLSRRSIFAEFHELYPQLIPYLSLIYGQHRNSWTRTADGPHTLVTSEEGVTQGHVLGPALFNVATFRPVLMKLNELLNRPNLPSDGRVLALHDDTFLIMDPSLVPTLWPHFVATFSKVGLEINLGPEKSSLYIPSDIPITEDYLTSLPNDLATTRDGIKGIGVPLGTDEFCENFWSENLVNPIRKAIPLVCQYYDTQKALTLFRLCINTKQNYCLRMTDPNSAYASRLTMTLQGLFKLGLAYLLDKKADILNSATMNDCISDRVWQQATLPAKSGGLSILDPVLVHHPAFIASQIAATLSHLLVSNILQLMSTNTGNHSIREIIALCPRPSHELVLSSLSTQLIGAFDQYKSSIYVPMIPNAIRPQVEVNLNNDLSISSLITSSDKLKIQKYLMKLRYEYINRVIRLTWPSRDINRLNSASNEGAIPITVLPILKEFCISANNMFSEILCYRLGVAYSFTPTGTCACGAPLLQENNSNHFHVQSVCAHGNHRQSKHNAIRDVLIQLFRTAGYIAKGEPVIVDIARPTTKERLDLVVDNYTPGKSLYIDVSISDVMQKKYNTSLTPVAIGKAAADREATKISNHGESCQRIDSYFAPFVIEQAGNWGIKTRELFNNIITLLIQRRTGSTTDSTDTNTKRYYKCKIMMAYFRASCIGFHRRCDTIKRARQHPISLNENEDYNEFPYNELDVVNPTLVEAALA